VDLPGGTGGPANCGRKPRPDSSAPRGESRASTHWFYLRKKGGAVSSNSRSQTAPSQQHSANAHSSLFPLVRTCRRGQGSSETPKPCKGGLRFRRRSCIIIMITAITAISVRRYRYHDRSPRGCASTPENAVRASGGFARRGTSCTPLCALRRPSAGANSRLTQVSKDEDANIDDDSRDGDDGNEARGCRPQRERHRRRRGLRALEGLRAGQVRHEGAREVAHGHDDEVEVLRRPVALNQRPKGDPKRGIGQHHLKVKFGPLRSMSVVQIPIFESPLGGS